jgi:hypothetical protein
MKLAGIVALATLVLGSGAFADERELLSSYRVVPRSDAAMREIALKFDVEGKIGDGVVVFTPPARAGELLKLAPHAELLQYDISEAFRNVDLRGYHIFETM